jgi:hypothetical protein
MMPEKDESLLPALSSCGHFGKLQNGRVELFTWPSVEEGDG